MRAIFFSFSILLVLFSCRTTGDEMMTVNEDQTSIAGGTSSDTGKPYHFLTAPGDDGGGSGMGSSCTSTYSFALNDGSFFSGQKPVDACDMIVYSSSFSSTELTSLSISIVEENIYPDVTYTIQNQTVTNPSPGIFNININIKKSIKVKVYPVDGTKPYFTTQSLYFNKNINVNTETKTIN